MRLLIVICRSEVEWIIFNYMSEGLFSLARESNPSAKVKNPGQLYSNLTYENLL